jgi:1-acyl-sn-glycerol-3-phosphate acyltransferase
VAIVLYRVLNRTRIHGRWNVGVSRNTLICANHRTMIDSYLIGHITAFPTGLVMPWTLPYHPAAQENFFRNPIISWFSNRWKCIPVRRGAHDFNALHNMIETLPRGQMLIFPEGTRSRTGDLLPGRPGTGKLIHDSRCKVVPVYVKGMSDVLPVGTAWPRLFRSIEVNIGTPVPLDDLLALPDSRETSQAIIDRVMLHIQALKDDLELRAERRAASRAYVLSRLRAAVQLVLRPVAFIRR